MSSVQEPGTFYPVWPHIEGKTINLQWGEIRNNTAETKAIVRNSWQDVDDTVDILNAVKQLTGFNFGEFDFRNRYRIIFRKVDKDLVAQRNDGTEETPDWVDVWSVRWSDGQFKVSSIYAEGYYGLLPVDDFIGIVGEAGRGAVAEHEDVRKLFFNSEHGFYLTKIAGGTNKGGTVVNQHFPFGRAAAFSDSGIEWEIEHNFNFSPVIVQVMDANGKVVIPDTVDVSDPNKAYFYFNESFSGQAMISSGSSGAYELRPRDIFYLVARTDSQRADTNLMNENAHLVFDENQFYVNVDLDTDHGGKKKQAYVSIHTIPDNVAVDHGALNGLADDDHTQYTLVDGTRDFTGEQSMGDNKLTELAAPTDPTDAARKQETDAAGPGFYGITVKQADDEAVFRGIDVIAFDPEHFYIIQNDPNTDEVLVNYREKRIEHGDLGGLTDDDHTQYTLRTDWLQNGIVDADDVSLVWTDTAPARTLKISPASTSFDYFIGGIRYTEVDTMSQQITDTDGLHMIYIDSEGTLAANAGPSESEIDRVIEDDCIIAFVMWDSAAGDGRLMPELHGYNMAPDTHHWIHDNIGAVYKEGMALADFVISNGADNEDAQFSIAEGEFYDEDVEVALSAISKTTGSQIWYLDTGVWKFTTSLNGAYKVLNAGVGANLVFNDVTGAGTLTTCTNNRYVLCHIFATNVTDDDGTDPKYIALVGQAQYLSGNAARVGADTEINNLVSGSLPLPELVPLATVIFQTGGYANDARARVVLTDSGDEWVDWRGSNIVASGGSISDHGSLAGLADDDHQQYTLVDGTRAFTGAQDMGANKLTGLAAGSASGDAVRFDEAITEDGANAFTGDQSMGDNKLTDLAEPTDDTDAARLQDIGPGFYGITVKQTDDEAVFRNVNVVAFDTDFFYITQNDPNTDEAIVNFRENVAFPDDFFTFDLPTGEEQKVYLDTHVAVSYDIVDVAIKCESGSATVGFYIKEFGEDGDGVSVQGLDPLAVTTSMNKARSTDAYTASRTDEVIMAVYNSNNAVHLRGTVRLRRV
jgi:hypothetical protein